MEKGINLSVLQTQLGLTVAAPVTTDAVVTRGYVSDLLSDVMGKAPGGSIWVTVQNHANIVAVAALADIAAIVIAGGLVPEQSVVDKAQEEDIAVYTTEETAFTLVGKLYQLGVVGGQKQG